MVGKATEVPSRKRKPVVGTCWPSHHSSDPSYDAMAWAAGHRQSVRQHQKKPLSDTATTSAPCAPCLFEGCLLGMAAGDAFLLGYGVAGTEMKRPRRLEERPRHQLRLLLVDTSLLLRTLMIIN